MNKKLVSVLIPAYNHEKFISKTIQSVISQSYKNIELIIVNDGSTDNTLNIISSLSSECKSRFSNFIVESQENKGTCLTLNRLLELSSGDFVLFLASDDVLYSNTIEDEITGFLYDKSIGLVVGINTIIDSNGAECFWDCDRNIVYHKNEAKWLNFNQFISDTTSVDFQSSEFGSYCKLLECNHVPNGCLIKKEVFDKIGSFTVEAPLEDQWMMLQIAKFYKFQYIPILTFKYRWYSNNSIKNTLIMQNYHRLTINYERKNFLRLSLRSDILPSYNNYCIDLLNSNFERYDELQSKFNMLKDYIDSLNKASKIKISIKLKKIFYKILHKCFKDSSYFEKRYSKMSLILFKIKKYKTLFENDICNK